VVGAVAARVWVAAVAAAVRVTNSTS
jgi:hypothetical protein